MTRNEGVFKKTKQNNTNPLSILWLDRQGFTTRADAVNSSVTICYL